MHSQIRNDNLVIICCDHNYGSVAQLNRALDYGSRGYRFESCRNHKRNTRESVPFFYPLNFEIWPLNFMIWDYEFLEWHESLLSFDLWPLWFVSLNFLYISNYNYDVLMSTWFLSITYETKSFAISIYIIRGIRSRLRFAWIMVWKNMT